MALVLTLTSEQRELFELVTRAVVANPFSDKRRELDLRLATEEGRDRPVTASVERVEQVLTTLEANDAMDLRRYRAEDRHILEFGYLFDLYYRYRGAFDELILEQERQGTESVPVPFARELLRAFAERGFDARVARRNLALFFQIRRAFFFIGRALTGESPCMRALRRDLWNDIFTRDLRLYAERLYDRMEDFSTLLLGETGTGKGSAASAIGHSGFVPFDEKEGKFAESFTGAFVSTNLSGVPEPLIESELFGHRRGAFTGAIDHREGLLARCSRHGAIFLDEIGETSVPVQVKLLQVLQERLFTPVGGKTAQRFRGRVISATNRPLTELRSGKLREDFFHRLSSDIVEVPPLRKRLQEDPEELRRLVAHLVERLFAEPQADLIDGACKAIDEQLGSDYRWSGNVRELEQCLRRLLLTGRYDAAPEQGATTERSLLAPLVDEGYDARRVMEEFCQELYRRHKSYRRVGEIARIDPRTARRYVAGGA